MCVIVYNTKKQFCRILSLFRDQSPRLPWPKWVKPNKCVPSERLQAARAKRDAARSRLREMKLAAAKMKETTRQEVEESKELDISPSKVMKMNERKLL